MKLKKLELKSSFDNIKDFCTENEIEILSITFEHFQQLNKLAFHHKDPFDRLIIAQAIAEKLIVLTKDENFSSYKVKCLWGSVK